MTTFAIGALLLVTAALAAALLVQRARASSVAARGALREPAVLPGMEAAAPVDPGTPEWQRVQDVLLAALARPVAARQSFVRAECGADRALFDEVMSLVSVSEYDGVLDDLAATVVQPMLAGAIREGETIGRYRIGHVLGQGGMGVVYRAHDLRLDRTVALKFLPPYASTDADAKQRFLIEARAAAALDHPNVCTIHEIGETESGFLFIAMPFYDGETLRERLSRGAMPVADAVAVAMQVARGLAKAHERGIVHRDIKPANIVLTQDGVAKILDFGVAKLSSSTMTRTGVQPGTVAYMSPEQASGGDVDHRSDIWALGMLLHEMLVGRHAFDGVSDAAMLHSILTRDAPSPSRLREDVPIELDHIVQRALARSTAVRYGDIREMASDLEECAARTVMADEARSRPRASHVSTTVPAEGERRSVTVLVSSIAGSVDAFDRLAPADADAVMQSLRDSADRIMRSHGGVLNEVTGEELICLFGVPEAHEDDYVRAVRAASELHTSASAIDAVQIRLQSGVDAGVVLARPSDARDRAFRIAGDPVRTATLLSTQAEPDAILVSPRCQRLIAPYYLTRALPPIAGLRGEARFVPHSVLGKSGFESRLEAAGPQGLTQYTGRENELSALRDAFAMTLRGQGSVVGVVGDAGVGKSRLLHEFRQDIDSSASVAVGRCQTQDGRTPYEPFVPVLLRALGLNEDRSDAGLAAAAAAAIQQDVPSLSHLIPLCLQVLGLESNAWPMPRDLSGVILRSATSEAIATLLTTIADRKPLVILLEDWHWADEASRDALDTLVALAGTHRLLIVVSCRPDVSLDWGWSRQHTTLRLEPLDDVATGTIMRSVLRADDVTPEFVATIHERTGGNPFFIEELCRALVEEGSLGVEAGRVVMGGDPDSLNLPETVQLVIRTRLDRLDPASRHVLRTASVMGREFERTLLESVSDDRASLDASLARLRDAGLIQPVRLLPDAVYRFRHALTQEVAYSSLPDHLSRAMHLRVGEAIETQLTARAEPNAAELCAHFAAAEVWQKALRYARQAAARMSQLSRPAAARAQLDRALPWIDRLDADEERERLRVDLLLEHERYISALGDRDEQRRILHSLIDLLEPAGDSAALVQVLVRIGELGTLTDDYDAADDALGKALHVARRLGDMTVEADVCTSLAFLRWHQGQNEEGRALLERTIDIRRDRGDNRMLIGDLINIATIISRIGDHATAISTVEQALDMCRDEDLPSTEVNALVRLAYIHRDDGDVERSFEFARRAYERASGAGLTWMTAWTGTVIAETHLRIGNIDACLAEYMAAVETSRRTGIAFGVASAQRSYGLVLYGLGRYAEAVEPLREASVLLERVEKREDAAQLAQALAHALERVGDDAGALAEWNRLRAHRHRAGDDAGELAALEGIARTQRRTGVDVVSVIASLEDAAVLAERLDDLSRRGSFLNTMGIIEFERHDMPLAMKRFEAARSVFEKCGDAVNATQMTSCIAACEARLGHHDAAIAAFKTAIAGHRANEQHRLEAQALGALGDVYEATADLASATLCYEESLRIRREIGDRAGEGWMLLSLGRASARAGRNERPESYWDAARSIALECGDDELSAALAACAGKRAE